MPTNDYSIPREVSLGNGFSITTRPLPEYYPLAATHRAVTLKQSIFQNLVDCFRLLSVQARTCRDGTLCLETPELVEFQLIVWQLPQDGRFCVETTRVCGDVTIFHEYSQHILDAASGVFNGQQWDETRKAREYRSMQTLAFMEKSEGTLSPCPTGSPLTIHATMVATEAMDAAGSMIRNDRLDSQLLGLEMLEILTDHQKTHPAICCRVSSMILLLRNGEEDTGDARFSSGNVIDTSRILYRLVCKQDDGNHFGQKGNRDKQEQEEVDYDSDDEDGGFYNSGIGHGCGGKPLTFADRTKHALQHRAMAVFGNALMVLLAQSTVTSTPGVLPTRDVIAAVRRQSLALIGTDVFQATIEDTLLQTDNTEQHNLQTLCLGSRVVRIGLQKSDSLRREVSTPTMVQALRALMETGKQYHAGLERETRSALNALVGDDNMCN